MGRRLAKKGGDNTEASKEVLEEVIELMDNINTLLNEKKDEVETLLGLIKGEEDSSTSKEEGKTENAEAAEPESILEMDSMLNNNGENNTQEEEKEEEQEENNEGSVESNMSVDAVVSGGKKKTYKVQKKPKAEKKVKDVKKPKAEKKVKDDKKPKTSSRKKKVGGNLDETTRIYNTQGLVGNINSPLDNADNLGAGYEKIPQPFSSRGDGISWGSSISKNVMNSFVPKM
jgi:hypothetical protein